MTKTMRGDAEIACSSCGLTMAQSRMLAAQPDGHTGLIKIELDTPRRVVLTFVTAAGAEAYLAQVAHDFEQKGDKK